MLVNNETGAVNPISGMAREIKRRGLPTLLHTDAVQGFMKIPFTVRALGADLVTVSAHKIHGPKGAGALYVKKGLRLPPLLLGGGQESGRRSGTEALPAVVGFGEAARLYALEQVDALAHVSDLRDFTVNRLREALPEAMLLSDTCFTGDPEPRDRQSQSGDALIQSTGDWRSQSTGDWRSQSTGDWRSQSTGDWCSQSPYILSLSLPGYKSEVLMNYLEAEGIFVAKSSACKRGARSHVLEAMGLQNAVIDGALRVSFSRDSTREEAEYFVATLRRGAESLYKTLR